MALQTNSLELKDTLTSKYIKLRETGGGTSTITLQAPAAGLTSYTLTWPTGVGVAGQVLSTDGAGTLSWITASSGGGTSSFADNDIELYNAVTSSKKLHFSAAAVSSESMRVVAMPNSNVDLGTLPTQLLLTTSTPQFAKLGVGQAAGTETLEVNGEIAISNFDGLTVGGVTPSSGPWLYMENLNQDVSTTSIVRFAALTVDSIKLHDSTTHDITIISPASLGASYALTMPSTSGTVDYVLATNGTGTLSWASQGSGSGASFSDSVFEIYNSATPSKKIVFDVTSGAGTTRTITVPDSNISFANVPSQGVGTTSTPQFAQLGVGQAAGAETLNVTGNIKVSTAGGLTIGAVTPSATQWGYVAGMNQSLGTSSTATFNKVSIGAGTVSAPSLYFNGHTGSGFYRIGANNIGVAISGTKALDIATGVASTGLVKVTDGTSAAPGISFSSATSTGIYRIASDNVGIAVAGTKTCDLKSTQSFVNDCKIKNRAVYGSIYKKGTWAYINNALSDWTPAYTKSSFTSVTWSADAAMFVAVADSSPYIAVSSNNRQWYTVTAPVSLQWRSVIYGGGQFVATALNGTGNGVMTSSNGTTWVSRAPVANQSWRSVAYGNGRYCAVSNDGAVYRIMSSTDAITWSSVSTPVLNMWWGICYGSAAVGFVAVSYDGSGNRVMTSTDGLNWVSQTSPFINFMGVCYSPELNMYCAVGMTGIATSTDGATWISRTVPYAAPYTRNVAWSAELGIFCVTTDSGLVYFSQNGVSWYCRSINASAGSNQKEFPGITWSGEYNTFVIVGYDSTKQACIFYSYDPRANLALIDSDYRLHTIKINNTAAMTRWQFGFGTTAWLPYARRFVNIGYNGSYYPGYSQYEGPPITWTFSGSSIGSVQGIAANKTYVEAAGISYSYYSTDNFATLTSITNSYTTNNLCYSALTGYFVSANATYIAYNSGTSTWTTSFAPGGAWLDVCFSNELGRFIAVNASGYYATSTSATSGWTSGSISSHAYYSVCWSPELALFCAVTNSTPTVVALSSNGTTWQTLTIMPLSPHNEIPYIQWIPDMHMFVIFSQNSGNPIFISTSYDGYNWSTYASINCVAYYKSSYAQEFGMLLLPSINLAANASYPAYTVPKYMFG